MQEIKRTNSHFSERSSFLIFLMGIMLLGVFVGSLAFCSMDKSTLSGLSFVTQGFIQTRKEQGMLEILLSSLLSSSGMLLIIFLLGFSAVSQPIELMIPFFRGLGLGASIAQIYTVSSTRGFVIVFLLILPYAIITSFAIIIAVREAIKLSNILISNVISSTSNDNMKAIARLYFIKLLVLEAIIAFGAIVDCICSMLFSGILLK